MLPFAPFAPVVERNGQKPFLSDFPYNLLKEVKVLGVPWISSNTAHERVYSVFCNYFLGEANFD